MQGFARARAVYRRWPDRLRRYWVDPNARIAVKRWHIARRDWTAAPLRIALLSDFHLGEPTVDLNRLRRIVARTNAVAPDLVLLGGDFAPAVWRLHAHVDMDAAARCLATLSARHGVFAVLGNHDWAEDPIARARGGLPNIFAEALVAQGIPVLSNQSIWLEQAGIWLAGLEDQRVYRRWRYMYRGLDDLEATLSPITGTSPVVLLAHEPDIFPQVPARIALTLSGHTHGGQIRLFGRTPVVPSRYGSRFAYGHVHEAGRDLVVSGGLGCSGVPYRLGVMPEITVIELEQAV